jgi:hypothetical protein
LKWHTKKKSVLSVPASTTSVASSALVHAVIPDNKPKSIGINSVKSSVNGLTPTLIQLKKLAGESTITTHLNLSLLLLKHPYSQINSFRMEIFGRLIDLQLAILICLILDFGVESLC